MTPALSVISLSENFELKMSKGAVVDLEPALAIAVEKSPHPCLTFP